MIFKIVGRDEWAAACRHGKFIGSVDDIRDGFIHLSAADQVQATAAKYFKGREDLVLVAFEAAALGAALTWEPSRGGQLFPHFYAPLPTSLAVWTRALPLGADGVPLIPEGSSA